MEFGVVPGVYTANTIALVLLAVLYLGNMGRMAYEKNVEVLNRLIFFIAIICIADSAAHTVNGNDGTLYIGLNHLFTIMMYISSLLAAYCWLKFWMAHVRMPLEGKRKKFFLAVIIICSMLLIINIFCPFIYSLEGGVYIRLGFYWIFPAVFVLFMFETVYTYFVAKKNRGILEMFPLYMLIIPIAIGVFVQSFIYGISAVGVSAAISVAGIMTSFKNELIYTDRLTGLYNRFYLEILKRRLNKNKDMFLTGIMADLNGFKSINDLYGHNVGDEALIEAAGLFQKAVGDYGTVTRYAGDEFVIFLRTIESDEVDAIIARIEDEFENSNRNASRPYKLSVSLGYAVLNLKNMTANEFMNMIDTKMYENKVRHYTKDHFTD
jgi:diguanylate cyclase (GGDEF)-like protein